MSLKAVVEQIDEVDEKYRDLYTEKNGKYEITAIEGLKTQADVDRLQAALTKERADHKSVKEKYGIFAGLDLNEVQVKLDKYDELEEAAKGKLDDSKIDELVGKRLKTHLAPVEREREALKKQLAEASAQVEQFKVIQTQRAIADSIRSAATAAKLLPEAIEDAMLLAERTFEVTPEGRVLTKEGSSATVGIEPSVWFTELQAKRPHWWGPSIGGGASGGRGTGGQANPWSAEAWNMTEQGKILVTDRARAEQLAKSAGTTIGGAKPPAKK